MERIFKSQLFNKGYLVADNGHTADREYVSAVLFTLACRFGIKVVSGYEKAQMDMIGFVAEQLGEDVPKPFYRGFPNTVLELSEDKLLVDQLVHYLLGYGLDLLDGPGYSIFEETLERVAFSEETEPRLFQILDENDAEAKLKELAQNLLLSSRPLSQEQYDFLLPYIQTYGVNFERCASKNTVVRILLDTRDLGLLRFLMMSDVMKVLEELCGSNGAKSDLHALNLRNQDRKFITAVIDKLFYMGRVDINVCCEKKALWAGLLHHIHYRPETERATHFVCVMRGKENFSAYSRFEKEMRNGNIEAAIDTMLATKGQTGLLRNMNYIASRCQTQDQLQYLASRIESRNVVVMIQLLLQYDGYNAAREPRDFCFMSNHMLVHHHESEEESARRKSVLSEEYASVLAECIRNRLEETVRGKLGKVYVAPDMDRMALPLQEEASHGGYGVLTRGSRLPIPEGKKLRAFTYWEKVDDIDLSVIGLDVDKQQTEFSWRTMYGRQSRAITFSGDQTRGYHGGSEYFDIVMDQLRAEYPKLRYLIFCNNVFSRGTFSQCFCKAGYMLRDEENSGEVFEPKTVRSSFMVNCNSSYAYLFGIDLEKREIIWLNTAKNSSAIIAGATSLAFLENIFRITDVISMGSFFRMAASEVVETPDEADIILSDEVLSEDLAEKQIRSCDFEKIYALYDSFTKA